MIQNVDSEGRSACRRELLNSIELKPQPLLIGTLVKKHWRKLPPPGQRERFLRPRKQGGSCR